MVGRASESARRLASLRLLWSTALSLPDLWLPCCGFYSSRSGQDAEDKMLSPAAHCLHLPRRRDRHQCGGDHGHVQQHRVLHAGPCQGGDGGVGHRPHPAGPLQLAPRGLREQVGCWGRVLLGVWLGSCLGYGLQLWQARVHPAAKVLQTMLRTPSRCPDSRTVHLTCIRDSTLCKRRPNPNKHSHASTHMHAWMHACAGT